MTTTKKELIRLLNKWDSEKVIFDDGVDYFVFDSIIYGMGKGIIIKIKKEN